MEAICAHKNCSKLFLKTRKDKIYCSSSCKVKSSAKRNNRNWKRFSKCSGNHNSKTWKYRKHLKESCESCGFIPLHQCQLDVDHIDGNHRNNELSNLRTLCANCHRLKTVINQDWKPNNK